MDHSQKEAVEWLKEESLWSASEAAIKKSLDCFVKAGIELPVQEYFFTLLLANPDNPYTQMSEGVLRGRWHSRLYFGLIGAE